MKNLTFEELIIHCCKSPEDLLRKEIKTALTENGFSIFEDGYRTYRENQDPNHELKNLLLVKGNPKICLVAHTDTCRDHTFFNQEKPVISPDPIIKFINNKKIIQDKNNEIQVGGDDRLGVAIILYFALHFNKSNVAILLTTDEEIGMCSANEINLSISQFKLMIEIDRGNNSNQIVTSINGLRLCSDYISESLQAISVLNDLPREEAAGKNTDVYSFKRAGICKDVVNLTCGYHDSFGDDGGEFIDIQESNETLIYINHVFTNLHL